MQKQNTNSFLPGKTHAARFAVCGIAAVTFAGICNGADLSVGEGETHAVTASQSYDAVNLSGGTVELNDGGTLKCQTVNGTSSSASELDFAGGTLAASTWDKTWFLPASGASILLQSVEGNPIYLDVGYQRHVLSGGDGTVTTAGDGDVTVKTLNAPGSGRTYLTINAGNVTWGHAGDLKTIGDGGIRLQQGGTLPSGADVGGVKITELTHLYLDSQAGTDINSLEGRTEAIGWAWLRFGKYKDGVLKNTGDMGGVANVEKHGTATKLTIDNASFPYLISVGGAIDIEGSPVTVKELDLRNNTALTVKDTTLAATNSFKMSGTASVAVLSDGALDVTGASAATFDLASAGVLTKRGTAAWNVYAQSPLSGRLQISGGTLAFRYKEQQSCANDEWWRVSITKQQYSNKAVATAEIGLFSDSERVNQGLAASSAAVTSMDYGTAKITTGSFSGGNVAQLFDASGSTLWGPYWQDASPASPLIYSGNWLTVVMRLNLVAKGKAITSVDVADNAYYGDYTCAFKVESSNDGTTWIDRGSQSFTKAAKWSNWTGGSSHYAVNDATRTVEGTGKGGNGFAAGTVLRVDAGATLDTSRVKAAECVASALEIDATLGGGTVTDLAFAENGTINVVNLPTGTHLRDLVLNFAITSPAGMENLENWTVRIDGTVKQGIKAKWVDGQLRFATPGMMVIVR